MKLLHLKLDDVGIPLFTTARIPCIEAIICGGRAYTRFWGGPNCSNERAKEVTGLYSIRTGNLTGGLYKHDTKVSLPPATSLVGFCSRYTAHVGKWHLCAHEDYTHREDCGWAWYAGSQANLAPGDYFDWLTVENGSPVQTQQYATDYVAQRALERIAAGDNYISVCFNTAHEPVHAPPGFAEATREAMLSYADEKIGAVHDAAIKAGYLVILSSDQSGTAEDDGKGNLFTSTLNVPLVLSGDWPDTRALDAVVDATDLYATAWYEVGGGVVIPGTDGVPLQLAAGLSRSVAFADKFSAVQQPPGPGWIEAATDGVLKVTRRPASGVWVPTTWADEPTTEDVSHLLAALDSR